MTNKTPGPDNKTPGPDDHTDTQSGPGSYLGDVESDHLGEAGVQSLCLETAGEHHEERHEEHAEHCVIKSEPGPGGVPS